MDMDTHTHIHTHTHTHKPPIHTHAAGTRFALHSRVKDACRGEPGHWFRSMVWVTPAIFLGACRWGLVHNLCRGKRGMSTTSMVMQAHDKPAPEGRPWRVVLPEAQVT